MTQAQLVAADEVPQHLTDLSFPIGSHACSGCGPSPGEHCPRSGTFSYPHSLMVREASDSRPGEGR